MPEKRQAEVYPSLQIKSLGKRRFSTKARCPKRGTRLMLDLMQAAISGVAEPEVAAYFAIAK
jgi:hypothetical protein